MSVLDTYKAAAYPAVAVETFEESRLLDAVLDMHHYDRDGADMGPAPVYSISSLPGLSDVRAGSVVDPKMQYAGAFAFVADVQRSGSILFVLDFQNFVKTPIMYRSLKICFDALKNNGSMVILSAPTWKLPDEISRDFPVIPFNLPSRAQLNQALSLVSRESGIDVENQEAVLDGAAGLTLQEAENAFALSLVKDKCFRHETVSAEKMKLVKSSGLVTVENPLSIDSLGGLGNFREWAIQQVIPSMRNALLRVKGAILVGVQGGGKSTACRVMASLVNRPLVRCDVSSLKAGIVGESEANMGKMLKLVDAIAPCVLWLDEVEKAVGGVASSAQTDGGTSLGMFGAFLNWLQDHTSDVLTIATCNDFGKLPPEFGRAGRFDQLFFVDLPTASERLEIASIHLGKYAPGNEALAGSVRDISDGWVGAEIEQLIKNAARLALGEPGNLLSTDLLQLAASDIRPISKVKADEVAKLREWGRSTLKLANTVEVASAPVGRKVRVN
jgi:hypothetical protein